MTYGDLVTEALKEIRAARAGDVPSPDDMADGVSILNRIIDFWNANQRTVYSEDFQDFTLVPSLSPHTIGPTGTFNITQRPRQHRVRLGESRRLAGGLSAGHDSRRCVVRESARP
jgi:hypothetical protein